MELVLSNLSKRFGKHWVFSDVSVQLNQGCSLAILGGNGSGKSTLIQVVAGIIQADRGTVSVKNDQGIVSIADFYKYLALVAPYQELPNELTAKELFFFHSKLLGIDPSKSKVCLEEIELDVHPSKLIGEFSTGMKQRLKLSLALFKQAPILLLDEPTMNLDAKWAQWSINKFEEIVTQTESIVLLASNEEREYASFTKRISLDDYKK